MLVKKNIILVFIVLFLFLFFHFIFLFYFHFFTNLKLETGAGFLGIGAGLILSPLMISMGIFPHVAAATVISFKILFSFFINKKFIYLFYF